MLPLELEHSAAKAAGGSGAAGHRVLLGAPETRRSCGCGLLIYAVAALLLLWAAFPGASSRMWHRASPVAHTAQQPALAPDAEGAAVPGALPAAPAPASGDAAAPEAPAAEAARQVASGAGTVARGPSAAAAPLTAPAPAPGGDGRTDAWCPLSYPRMSLEDLEAETPYLFGGQPVGGLLAMQLKRSEAAVVPEGNTTDCGRPSLAKCFN